MTLGFAHLSQAALGSDVRPSCSGITGKNLVQVPEGAGFRAPERAGGAGTVALVPVPPGADFLRAAAAEPARPSQPCDAAGSRPGADAEPPVPAQP